MLRWPSAQAELWKKFGVVHVYLPPIDFILAHRLAAGREKDKHDIEALCKKLKVHTRTKAQSIIDKYISQKIQENNHVDIKLNIFFRT